MGDIEKLDNTMNNIDLLSKSLSDQLKKITNFHEKIADSCEKIMTFSGEPNSHMVIIKEPSKSLFLWFRNEWLLRRESFVPLFTREQLEELREYTKSVQLDRKNIEEFVYIWGMFIESDKKLHKMIKFLHDTDLTKYDFIMKKHPDGVIVINKLSTIDTPADDMRESDFDDNDE